MTLAQRLADAAAARRVVEDLDDTELGKLLGDAERGWGWTQRVTLDQRGLFVKAIPVTERERRSDLTTANLYGIPLHLNYPFGSPGLGVGRELAFARRSTAWVASDTHEGFPILVHDRVIDRRVVPSTAEPESGWSAYRADNDAMNRYLADRNAAPFLLVLVYESFPFTAVERLTEQPGDAPGIVEQVRSTTRFLRDQGVVHFDIDMFNIVTDGQVAFVTDHGLVLDREFELSDVETGFLAANRHFDEGSLFLSVGHQLYWNSRALPLAEREDLDRKLGIATASFDEGVSRLLTAVARRGSDRLQLDPGLCSLVEQFSGVIEYMHDFARLAKQHWSESTRLDDALLARLIDEAVQRQAV